jgi:hypothetical protein
MEKISRTDHVRQEVSRRIKEKRSILRTVKTGKAVGDVLLRNCV